MQRPPVPALRAALAALLIAACGVPGGLRAGASEEQQFLQLTNETRMAAGLAPLDVDAALVPFARGHTEAMMVRGEVFHSRREARLSIAPVGWVLLGENVGSGTTPVRLHDAFMQSPGHRANILGDYSHVAVGAARAPGGRLYVTLVFLKTGAPAHLAAGMRAVRTRRVPEHVDVARTAGFAVPAPAENR